MAGSAHLTRHARHLALAQVGAGGQARIEAGSALIIGVGGIGCPAATYLAASGVGHLILCDFDTVDATNLGRQTLFGPADIGAPKAARAAERLMALNPDITITPLTQRLDDAALAETISGVDVVLDGSDNFATRFQVNDPAMVLEGYAKRRLKEVPQDWIDKVTVKSWSSQKSTDNYTNDPM